MAFSDWSASSDTTNGTTAGVNISEGCDASNLNDWGRRIMTQLRAAITTALDSFLAGSSALPIANGGTAATTASAARTALGAAASGANSDITSLTALSTPLSVAQGGTGAATAAAALTSLGACGVTASSFSATTGYIKFTISGTVFILQWKDFTSTGNGTVAVSFPTAFASWARAWVNTQSTDTGADQNNPVVSATPSTTSANVTSSTAVSYSCTLFAIGV